MTRTVELLEMPTGESLLAVLPELADALTGIGPVLAPVAADDRTQTEMLTTAFGIGRPLAADEDDPEDPTVLVIGTSGSTGVPKGALLSRSALAASAAATQRQLGPPGNWLLALPAQHIAGLQVLLRSLAGGTAPHILDTGLPFTPERFVTATEGLPPGPRYVSLVPTQLQRAIADDEAAAALRTFTGVLVGGAVTSATLQGRARAARINLVTTYGMSETCGGCIYDGVPLPGVEATLEADGRVLLGGPVVGRGYRNLPAHPAFRRSADGRRTFLTDDLGEWSDGRLQILGRIDDVIVTGGLKIAPALLEAAITRLASVAEVVVVGVPDPEWGQTVAAVVVAADPDAPPELPQLLRACEQAGVPRALQPRSLVVVHQLPLRGPGKPDRAAAAGLARVQLARTAARPG